jgi:hypothetical protein
MTLKISDCVAPILGRLMTDTMERLWKELVIVSLWYNARKITENKSVRVSDALVLN